MKAIVALPAYDRLDLLQQCVSGLEKNDVSLFDLMLFPDKTNGNDANKIDSIAKNSSLNIRVHPRPKNRLGCNLNTIQAMSVCGEMDYSHIICLGSDILVSNNFIHDLLVLSEKFDAYSVIPTTGRWPIETKVEHVNSLIHGSISGHDLCLPMHHWKTIAPITTAISERFHPVGAWDVKNMQDCRVVMSTMLLAARKIQTPFTKPMIDHMGTGEINAACDGLLVTSCAFYGVPMVSYTVNRAAHPSDTGVHTTKEVWRDWYAGVVIDDLPKADPEKFRFMD